MLSHIHIGITDFDDAFIFYDAVFKVLDLELKFREPDVPWAGWKEKDKPRPLLLIGKAENGQAAAPGNGQMIALLAKRRNDVDLCYRIALEHGGVCEGKPGLRAKYHPNYYGTYFRDLDGNKLCVCSHNAE